MSHLGTNEGITVRLEALSPVVDVVAVHGFNSSADGAWTYPGGPNWVVEPAFWGSLADKVRVMTFGYNANAFQDVITARIIDHAEKLLEDLFYERRSCKDRPLIFIAHSMGGLVVKRALLQAKQDDRYSLILRSTASIIFMATPHMGADRTGLAVMAQRLVAWLKLRSSSHTALSKELATFSDSIVDINRSFKPASIEIVDFFEMKETRLPEGSALIVEPASAILSGNPNERHIPSSCTHEEICKFERPEDPRFKSLWKQLDLVIDSAVEANLLGERLAAPDLSISSHDCFPNLRLTAPTSTNENEVQIGSEIEVSLEEETLTHAQKEARAAQDRFLLNLSNWKTYRQREERLSRHAGTCEWIFGHPSFKSWCQLDTYTVETSTLFILGPSGCGKSVIANHIANTLKQHYRFTRHGPERTPSGLRYSTGTLEHSDQLQSNITVLRFFCRDSQYSTQKAGTNAQIESGSPPRAITPIIESFLYQILVQHRQLFHSVSTYLSRQSTNFTPNEIQAMFRQLLASQQNGHIFLVIDGLDECEDTFIEELLEYLDLLIHDTVTRVASDKSSLLKVLWTCQSVRSIPFWSCRYSSIHIQIQDVSPDIATYVRDEVQDIARSRKIETDLVKAIEEVLVTLAGRMFLWAYFMLRELRQIPVVSNAAILSTISSFPRDLDRYYGKTLLRIFERSCSDAPREQHSAMILLVVVFSLRSFGTKEIAEILAISEDRSSRDEMVNFINTDIQTLVENRLSPLVAVDDNVVAISHYSIYEYLKDIRPMKLRVEDMDIDFNPDDENGHAVMAELCLRYLLLHDFAILPRSYVGKWEVLDKHFPFLLYASTCWFEHVRRAGTHLKRIIPLARKFLDTSSTEYQLWDNIYCTLKNLESKGSPTPILSTLVRLDLFFLYEKLDESRYNTSHIIGSFSGWVSFAKNWLGSRLKAREPMPSIEGIDQKDRQGLTASHIAILRGHPHWLQFLLHMGAVLSVRTSDDLSALHLAAFTLSDIASAKILLQDDIGLSVNDSAERSQAYSAYTPLCIAAQYDNSHITSLLLDHGASVDPDLPDGRRPLFLAVAGGHQDTALLLLEHNPKLALRDENGNTLLHLAAHHGLTSIAKYLITKLDDIDIDSKNKDEYTPLQIAVISGSAAMIKVLLAYGASIEGESGVGHQKSGHENSKKPSKTSPLGLAVKGGQTACALLLLDKGAKCQLDSWSEWTLLHEAAEAGNLQVLKRLHKQGMDINQASSDGRTPLHLATTNNDLLMVAFILSLNPDLNPPTFDSQITPLHMAAWLGASEIVRMLLERGADIRVKSKMGVSPLCAAALTGKRDTLKILISYGPDLDTPDNFGSTPLLESIRREFVDCVSLLLNEGASTATVQKSADNPLHAAVWRGNLEMTELLLDAKADINSRTKGGYTPLMIACKKGDEIILDELVKRGADLALCMTPDRIGLFHLAAVSSKLTILKKVIGLIGLAEIDSPSATGATPFLWACKYAGIDIMKALVAQGANPHRLTKYSENAVHFATYSGRLSKVRYLLSLQVSCTIRDQEDYNPLDLACRSGHVDIAEALIKIGADFRYVNKYSGETCIHLGARFGMDGIIDLLINKGADLEIRDWFSLTPLLRAVVHFRRNATRLLVAAGANIDVTNNLNQTAFKLTMQQYHNITEHLETPALPDSLLRDVILSNIDLSRGNDTNSMSNIARLARNLLRLEDDSNALRAYFLRLDLPDPLYTSMADVTEDTVLTHWATCDNCQNGTDIVGKRYKCRTCDDLDLCSSCMDDYRDGNTGPNVCKNHVFFEIPDTCPYLATMVFEKDRFRAETRAWLDGLHAKYSAMECSSSRAIIDRGAVVEVEDTDVALWILRSCGIDILCVKAVWAFRKAATSVPFRVVVAGTDTWPISIRDSQD